MIGLHQQTITVSIGRLYMGCKRADVGQYTQLVIIAVKQKLDRFSSIVRNRHRGNDKIPNLKLPMAVNNVKIATVWLYLAAFKATGSNVDLYTKLFG